MYFFEYVLHWKPAYPNRHLEFGVAWHLAKEHLLLHGCDDKQLSIAFGAFLSHFRKYYTEEDDLLLGNKGSGSALLALKQYAKDLGYRNTELKVIETEVAGRIELDDCENFYSVKIDAIVEWQDRLWCLDHKTASRDSATDDAGRVMSAQFVGYAAVMRSYYGVDKVGGALVDVSVLRSKDSAHKRLICKYNEGAYEDWYSSVLYYLGEIQFQLDQLQYDNAQNSCMKSFPQNTESCTQYGRTCSYYDICAAHCNPLSINRPIDMVQSIWNPHTEASKGWAPNKIIDDIGIRLPTAEELASYEAVIKERDARWEAAKDASIDNFY
jgi:hypothetical protein